MRKPAGRLATFFEPSDLGVIQHRSRYPRPVQQPGDSNRVSTSGSPAIARQETVSNRCIDLSVGKVCPEFGNHIATVT